MFLRKRKAHPGERGQTALFYHVPETRTVGWVVPTLLFSLVIKSHPAAHTTETPGRAVERVGSGHAVVTPGQP